MIAQDLIAEDLPFLKHNESGEHALNMMDRLGVHHLPILKQKNFVGLLSEDDLLNQSDISVPLTQLFEHLPRPYVLQSSHIYEVIKRAGEDHLSSIPVLDDKEQYVGCIRSSKLISVFSKMEGISGKGGILVLSMNETDYSLGQIAQIIEGENARILSSYISSHTNSKNIELTLKINTFELGGIIQALNRYDYIVKTSFRNDSINNDIHDRYEAVMRFLNI